MTTWRTSDELDTLRSDLRALREDLRAVARDLGALTADQAAHGWRRRPSVADWLGRIDWLNRIANVDLGSRAQALASLRTQGERSAAAVRSTVIGHPISTALAALTVGLAVAWFLSRSSGER
jgi:hypothetical protein